MQKISFYDQLGIVIPGSLLVVGLVLYFPDLRLITTKDAISVGELGLFVLIAYAAGHLVAAVGNALESVSWKIKGGNPSTRISNGYGILSSAQQELLRAKIGSRLGIAIASFASAENHELETISRHVYADVAKNGKPERVDTFNGNYGLNRGLSSACLVLMVVAGAHKDWAIAGSLFVVAVVYAFRASRFSKYYARELYLQFLVLSEPDKPA